MKFYYLSVLCCIVLSTLNSFGQVNPIQLGNSQNGYSTLLENKNSIYANDATGLVLFIHRQKVPVGSAATESGKLQYDISTNGGQNFTTNVGILNSSYTKPARYPQITAYSAPGNNSATAEKLVYVAPTLGPSSWEGIVSGVGTSSTAVNTTQEFYGFNALDNAQEGGLCEGLSGEFWFASSLQAKNKLDIYKGVLNANGTSVSWSLHEQITVNHNSAINGGSPLLQDPNIMFSPDGMTGWAGFMGDIQGGLDSTVLPIVVATTDGGVTWGNPIEIDLRNVNYQSHTGLTLEQELKLVQFVGIDPNGNTITLGNGIPCLIGAFDITVDALGHPHILAGVANRANNNAYAIWSGGKKLLLDIYSTDGGITWQAVRVSNILTISGAVGLFTSQSSTISFENYPQIARDITGNRIFYSWVDSDSTGRSLNVFPNALPNLKIASRRITDGFMTCPKNLTENDNIWNENAYFPKMASEVFTSANGNAYSLPIVMTKFNASKDADAEVSFWYFGDDAVIYEGEYVASASNLNTDSCTVPPGVNIAEAEERTFQIFPNPSSGSFTVELNQAFDGQLEVYTLSGQRVYQQTIEGEIKLDLNLDLAKGVYVLRLSSQSHSSTQRLIIQ